MISGDILFEARIVRIDRDTIPVCGWVESNGVQVAVDLSLLTNIVEGTRVLVCGRIALSTVEETHEICR
jgi:hydrogenase maturation factor